MGSWNETCALSNLPICPGEPVIFLMLTQNPYSDNVGKSGCYVGDHFFPRSVPLTGVYDDYGRVAIDEGQEAAIELIRQGFAQDLIKVEARKYRHDQISMETWSIDNVQEWLHEGALRIDKNALHRISDAHMASLMAKFPVKNPEADRPENIKIRKQAERDLKAREKASPSPIYKAIIRRDVWDAFLSIECRSWYGVYTAETYKAGADAAIDTILKDMNKPPISTADPEITRLLRSTRMALRSRDHDPFVSRFLSIGGGGDPPFEVSNKWVAERVVDQLQTGEITGDDARKVFKAIAELGAVEHVMSMTRRGWHPTTGMGSQGEELDLSMEVFVKLAQVAEEAIVKNLEKGREWAEDGETARGYEKLKALKTRLRF